MSFFISAFARKKALLQDIGRRKKSIKDKEKRRNNKITDRPSFEL
jgi:hypothetical protein